MNCECVAPPRPPPCGRIKYRIQNLLRERAPQWTLAHCAVYYYSLTRVARARGGSVASVAVGLALLLLARLVVVRRLHRRLLAGAARLLLLVL
eukprot:scaffold10915_cov65-Phaeocystis_antarctica.AAC.1